MQKRQIVNIVNFIRAVEPRHPIDMEESVRQQIRLMKKHHLRGTFLLQYDALLLPEYTDMLAALDREQFELGVWLEVVQPQVEAVGIKWTGRFPWDWFPHCGFSVGYTKEEREKLADVLFEKFRSVFGFYPRVFGSWLFDSHTIRYISDKYGLDAICNCKEQYGTDGYTLWGGYYGQGYYPARNNVFMPAQTDAQRIPAPIFRMLGSDPIYQYDFGMDIEKGADEVQGVVTLEPVYTHGTGGGGVPAWVDWYMKENFNGECLTFGYAQAGQENSFGWPGMKDGLSYQFDLFEKLEAEGRITVEPLGETGRWFKKTFSDTPASAITAHGAFDDPEKSSVWYSTKKYRVNLYVSHGKIRIRDMHVFSENLPDPYENTVCEGKCAVYETLPVVDGNRMSGNGVAAGVYITLKDGNEAGANALIFTDEGNGIARVTAGDIVFVLRPDGLEISAKEEFSVENRMGKTTGHVPEVTARSGKEICLAYRDCAYALRLNEGKFVSDRVIVSENGRISVTVD